MTPPPSTPSTPLSGRRILVTRPEAQAVALGEAIRAKGGVPVFFPLLKITPADELEALRRVAPRLEEYAMVVFVSPNAVRFGLPALLGARTWPERVKAAAIGPGTEKALTRHGVGKVLVPLERFDSEALLELPAFQKSQVEGLKALIVRGDGGRELIAETLTERGATVEYLSCYHRAAPTDASGVETALREGLDAVTVSSSEGLRALPGLLDAKSFETLSAVPLFVPHVRIAQTAEELGLRKVILTPPADAGIIDGLCVYFIHS
ncbi:MAG: uroporphyrinogen-III synthase [Candidatus Accumulibacter sp.]|jgi:uroporphyrinogen-III synthase|nr:uroporphyrinogen-III synthase [Accumulibacter sp.]